MQSQDRNETCKGQNKLVQNMSLLMCFCNFATGYFLILKPQSVKHFIELMFKVQISLDTPMTVTKTRVVVLRQIHFCELNSTFNGNSHYKLFAIFLSNRCEFLSDDLATYSLQRFKRTTDET